MNKAFSYGFHPFHIVDQSPWPLMGSIVLMSFMLNMFSFMVLKYGVMKVILSLVSLLLVMVLWWRDVIRESTFQGHHSLSVCNGLYSGVIMFITSEVMFFFSFFFGYLFTALNTDVELGSSWPPAGIQPLLFNSIPSLNTIILVSSGVSITWAHHSLISSNLNSSKIGMLITIFLGLWFSSFQSDEYFDCCFSMADSVYGSLFFISTGFHGLHIIIGVLFILVMLVRLNSLHLSKSHHLGFEAAAWYWHFVDVVWLFLFILIYWWGS